MKINNKNYFESSKGDFKIIPQNWVKKVLSVVDFHIDDNYNRHFSFNAESVKLGNHNWIPNFISYSVAYNSVSIYFISEDKTHLLRISDHWSTAPKGIKTCGAIRNCYWNLKGTKPTFQVELNYNAVCGGIIAFDALQWNN